MWTRPESAAGLAVSTWKYPCTTVQYNQTLLLKILMDYKLQRFAVSRQSRHQSAAGGSRTSSRRRQRQFTAISAWDWLGYELRRVSSLRRRAPESHLPLSPSQRIEELNRAAPEMELSACGESSQRLISRRPRVLSLHQKWCQMLHLSSAAWLIFKCQD